MTKKRILYVEDERELSRLVTSHLIEEGYEVDQAFTFSQALILFQTKRAWDAVLLDLYLPDGDGLELLKFFREAESTRRVPILILSARSGDMNRIRGLELGADDYLEKPFSLNELSLRLKKILSRREEASSSRRPSTLVFQLGENRLIIEQEKRRALLNGMPLDLTPVEFKILQVLATREGEALTRDDLLSLVWGDDSAVFDRTVDAFIAKIRKKLGPFKDSLETVRGYGYRFKIRPP